ncbi:MAG: hypothetical protein IT452_15585 [Planctomycetia bacterium]|nr:hypothetical protein [Planctomycetia bacterium]
MPIEFSCSCGRRLQVAEDLSGRDVRCPVCFKVVTAVVAPPEPPTADLAPEAARPLRRKPRPGAVGGTQAQPVTSSRVSKLSVAGAVVSMSALALAQMFESITLAIVGGLAGALISIIAWIRVRASGGRLRGSEFASTGLAVGLGGVASGLALLLLAVVFLVVMIYVIYWILQLAPVDCGSSRR